MSTFIDRLALSITSFDTCFSRLILIKKKNFFFVFFFWKNKNWFEPLLEDTLFAYVKSNTLDSYSFSCALSSQLYLRELFSILVYFKILFVCSIFKLLVAKLKNLPSKIQFEINKGPFCDFVLSSFSFLDSLVFVHLHSPDSWNWSIEEKR